MNTKERLSRATYQLQLNCLMLSLLTSKLPHMVTPIRSIVILVKITLVALLVKMLAAFPELILRILAVLIILVVVQVNFLPTMALASRAAVMD